MAKYFADVSGKMTEVQSIITSSGVGDANKIVETNSSGVLDISLFPTGIGVDVTVAPSSENLTTGDFVNKYNNGGALNIRKAEGSPCFSLIFEGFAKLFLNRSHFRRVCFCCSCRRLHGRGLRGNDGAGAIAAAKRSRRHRQAGGGARP